MAGSKLGIEELTAENPVTPSRDALALDELRKSFIRTLRAGGKSPGTVVGYLNSLDTFRAFLEAQGMPLRVDHLTREHVESFIVDQLQTRANATARTRYAGLRVWFNWLLEEGEITASPMARMKSPKLAERTPPVLTDDQLRALLATCKGTGFLERRDTAILWLLLDTGMRRAELAGLTRERVDLDAQTASVIGKGNRERICPFGPKTALAIDRYLRVRRTHRFEAEPALWLGQQGPLNGHSVYTMVTRRAEQAKLPKKVWPHLFRHHFAGKWLDQGGQEGDLMQLGGWRSRDIMARYASAHAARRAVDAYRKLGLSDKL